MTTEEMLNELREVLADEVVPYRLSSMRALAYLNEGQDKFCEDTGLFEDTLTFSITTEIGVSSYALDTRIIRVHEVVINGRRLHRMVGHKAAASAVESQLWQTDRNTGMLNLWPTPSEVRTIELHTWRYPLAELALGSEAQSEIPRRLQRACIEWAAYKSYGHHDSELQDSTQAAVHKAAYRQYVLEGRTLVRNYNAESIEVGVDFAVNAGCI